MRIDANVLDSNAGPNSQEHDHAPADPDILEHFHAAMTAQLLDSGSHETVVASSKKLLCSYTYRKCRTTYNIWWTKPEHEPNTQTRCRAYCENTSHS